MLCKLSMFSGTPTENLKTQSDKMMAYEMSEYINIPHNNPKKVAFY